MRYIAHDYQRYATERILQFPECGLFLKMGLGKTVSTLTAIDILMYDMFEVKKVLVVAPKRVAEDTWTTEAEKWDHLKHLRISRVLGTSKERLAALKQDADIYVINRENVAWLVDLFRKDWDFDMLVIDELSSFKSPSSKRFKALKQVRPLISRVVGLTGTPTGNGLMDLWSEVYLLDRGKRLERSITQYRNRYFYPAKTNGFVVYSYEPKPGAKEAIEAKISDICISMSAEDYLDLPGQMINDVEVRLSDREMKKYKEMEQEHILQLDEDTITAATAAAAYGKLLQMANGRVYDEDGNVKPLHEKKLEALEEIVEVSSGEPILVFYNFRHDYDALMERFRSLDPKTLNSQQDIRDWNRGKIKMLLAHPASMGHGLNLQAGGHIIVWYGLNFSLELYLQANARLDRQGQKETVIIHRLIAKGTVDEDVIRRLDVKDATQESLMDSLKAKIRRYKDEFGKQD